jgi:hypothetical protein
MIYITNLSFFCKNSVFYSNDYDVLTNLYQNYPAGMFADCYFCKNTFVNIRPNLGCRKIEIPLSETFGVFFINGEPENEEYFASQPRFFARPLSFIFAHPLLSLSL